MIGLSNLSKEITRTASVLSKCSNVRLTLEKLTWTRLSWTHMNSVNTFRSLSSVKALQRICLNCKKAYKMLASMTAASMWKTFNSSTTSLRISLSKTWWMLTLSSALCFRICSQDVCLAIGCLATSSIFWSWWTHLRWNHPPMSLQLPLGKIHTARRLIRNLRKTLY